jgi:RND family efflux transporter MFP subunit
LTPLINVGSHLKNVAKLKETLLNRKILLPVIIVIGGVVAAAALVLNPNQVSDSPPARVPPKVSVIHPTLIDEPLIIDSQGTVEPAHRITLAAEVAGRVSAISDRFQRGGAFEQGDVLFSIDDTDARLALQRARASEQQAAIDLKISQGDFKRAQELKEQNLISTQAFEQAQLQLARAQAQQQATLVARQEAELTLERTQVKAPFRGRIENESLDVGQFINRGERVAELIALDAYEVRLPIARDQLAYLDLPFSTRGIIPKEQRPKVTLSGEFAGQEWLREAELIRTEAQIDSATRQIFAVASLAIDSNDSTLFPLGLFVKAEIEGVFPQQAYRLPRSSLAPGNRILTVDENNQLWLKNVDILRLEHDDVVIQGGLTPESLVCVSAGRTVVDGMRVEPVMMDAQ